MGKMNNDLLADDDGDVIYLSSDDEEDEVQNNRSAQSSSSLSNQQKQTPPPPAPVRSDVKIENVPPAEETLGPNPVPISNSSTIGNGNDTVREDNPHPAETVQEIPQHPNFTNFTFDAFALFGPENASMPIEERLASFINNVQSLTEEKIKLENAERQAKRQCDEATNQLTTANQEINKLKDDLVESQMKLSQQTSSISELQTVVETLKRQDTGSKSKLKTITGTLVNLQAKMVQILEETEMDNPSILSEPGTSGGTSTALALSSGNGSLAEAILKENIENFEKDFETKFSQIEEQDKEIKDELLRTNEMLQRIQASILQQYHQTEGSPASSSPLLTFESIEDQDMANEHLIDPAPGSSTSTATRNGITKKVSRQEDSKTNNNLKHARDSKRRFACVCGVRYGTKYSIDRHLRMEKGQKHFECTICTESFFELCALRKHYESVHQLHYPSKFAGCTACGNIFTSFEVFLTHRRRCDGKKRLVDP